MRRSRTTLALAAVLVSPLAALAVPAPSHAAEAEALAEWAFARAGTCASALSGGDSADWAAGSRCIRDRVDGLVVEMGGRLGGLLVDEAARFMTEQGRGVFGEHCSHPRPLFALLRAGRAPTGIACRPRFIPARVGYTIASKRSTSSSLGLVVAPPHRRRSSSYRSTSFGPRPASRSSRSTGRRRAGAPPPARARSCFESVTRAVTA